jgi:hypothetical protein
LLKGIEAGDSGIGAGILIKLPCISTPVEAYALQR